MKVAHDKARAGEMLPQLPLLTAADAAALLREPLLIVNAKHAPTPLLAVGVLLPVSHSQESQPLTSEFLNTIIIQLVNAAISWRQLLKDTSVMIRPGEVHRFSAELRKVLPDDCETQQYFVFANPELTQVKLGPLLLQMVEARLRVSGYEALCRSDK